MTTLTPELQQLLISGMTWLIGSMSALVIILFGVIWLIVKNIAKGLIAIANQWRADLTDDTNKIANELKEVAAGVKEETSKIAAAFESGLNRVAAAVSANREEYKGQLSEQKERIAIIETRIKPVDDLFGECRRMKTRLDLVEEHMPKIVWGKGSKE